MYRTKVASKKLTSGLELLAKLVCEGTVLSRRQWPCYLLRGRALPFLRQMRFARCPLARCELENAVRQTPCLSCFCYRQPRIRPRRYEGRSQTRAALPCLVLLEYPDCLLKVAATGDRRTYTHLHTI